MRGIYLLLIFGTLLMAGCQVDPGNQPRMNVILIITDDQGYGDLAFHGNPVIETPVLDQLSKESAEFTRFYVSPVCAPTRASLLTGRYHLRTGTSWVTHRKEVMRAEEVTLAEMFKENGYRTGLFGKWHNGKQYPHDPIGQGFDQFVGFKDGHLNNYFDPVLTYQFEEKRTEGYATDIITDEALAFIDDQHEPFFSMISYNTPHSPFQVDDQYFDKYKAKGLSDKDASVYGMVENIDDNIGRIRDHLKATGLAKNTLLIFMTDNGPNGWRFNNGLKGRKAHVDEGGVRVPFMIHNPQRPEWNRLKVTQMAAHIDVLPTLTDLLNLTLPKGVEVDGISLTPVLSGEKLKERYFFTHQVSWDFDTIPGAIRNDAYVLTRKQTGDELYDLLNDSVQQHDLIAEKPVLAKEMAREYKRWLTAVTANGLVPPPTEVGHANIPMVEFPAPDASDVTHLTFNGKSGWANDWFTGWQKGSQATWNMQVVAAMSYEVYLELSTPSVINGLSVICGDQTLSLQLESPAIAKDVPNQDRVLRGEVEEKTWPLVHLGTLPFKSGDHQLTLRADLPMDSLLEVKSIKLIPTS